MSILERLQGLTKAVVTEARTEMTDKQVDQCKAALRRDNRGYNVQPNRFDINTPYRVAINYQNKWHNYGNFKSAEVAAAIGGIVSVAYFGSDKAVIGEFDEAKAENDAEFLAWINDPRNAGVISKAKGESPSINDGGILAQDEEESGSFDPDEPNPF